MQAQAASGPGLMRLLEAAERFVFVVSRLCQRRADTGDSEFCRLAGRLFRNEISVSAAVETINETTNDHFSAELATAQMRALFQRDGFYSWSGLRYFLFEFEQHLRDEAGMHGSKLDWDAFNSAKRDHVTIEHIFPITPVSGQWPTFEQKGDTERVYLTNSLGNLLALSQSRNARFSNRLFKLKKQASEGVQGYFNRFLQRDRRRAV